MKVTKVVYMTRHGHRGPFSHFHNSPWNSSLLLLTPKGAETAYQRGMAFYSQHKEFFAALKWPNDVFVISTDKERTVSTAYYLLKGMHGEERKEDTLSNKVAYLANYGFKQSSLINDLIMRSFTGEVILGVAKYLDDQHIHHKQAKSHSKEIEQCRQLILKLHNVDIGLMNYYEIFNLYDNLACSAHNDIPFQFQEDQQILDALQFMHMFLLYDLMFASKEVCKFTNHFFFKSIINDLSDSNAQKLFIYSAHDSNILSSLISLGFCPKDPPYYASSLVICQYENKQIEVKYNDQSLNKCIFGVNAPVDTSMLILKLQSGMFANDEEFFVKSEDSSLYPKYAAEHSLII